MAGGRGGAGVKNNPELLQKSARVIRHLSILIGSTYSKNFKAYLNQKIASFRYSSLVLKRNSIIFSKGTPESFTLSNIYF